MCGEFYCVLDRLVNEPRRAAQDWVGIILINEKKEVHSVINNNKVQYEQNINYKTRASMKLWLDQILAEFKIR